MQNKNRRGSAVSLQELTLFAMYGAVIFAQKAMLAAIPNVHLVALLIISLTVVYRFKALYSVFVYILLEGVFYGFTTWFVPYLYVWPILWGVTMLLPQPRLKEAGKSADPNRRGRLMPAGLAVPVYSIVGALHGLLFGTMFAPAQALFFGLDFRGMLAWIAAGFPYDIIHGVSNFCMCLMVLPLVKALKKMNRLSAFGNPTNL